MKNDNINIDAPEASPSLLGRIPTRGAGVRRLNNVPKYIAIGLGASVVALMMYATVARGNVKYKKADTYLKATQSASPPREVLQNDETNNVERDVQLNHIDANNEVEKNQVPSINETQSHTAQNNYSNYSNNSPPPSPYAEQWAEYKQKQTSANQNRETAFMAALNAPTSINSSQTNDNNSIAGNNISQSNYGDIQTGLSGGLTRNNSLNGSSDNDAEFNGQDAKRGFLQQKNYASNYSSSSKIPSLSPYELKAGSIIPAIMIGGLNSDLPGQIIAQVSENVYDTKTGKHLLIPQGSRLVGAYDNGVTTGQSRVLVAWNRIIFPDASSLDLNMMPAADQSGYAGFNDKTNNHYGKTFGAALLMSIFSAGVQISQPQASNGENITNSQTIAGAIGQQLGQTGSQVIGRNIRVQPTLQIRPGYRFNVSVTKDFIISPL
ncbi:MAG: hypothetical protein J0L55_00565 [Caulobacterales bacterium]|nr:hypothetical protein [Caulobacterales bacterium]MCA0372245.1 conjugal transfer protein TrbI [Pseudomonadota bacterium]